MLEYPFGKLPCKCSGNCFKYYPDFKTVHPTCTRFDIKKYNSDASIRRGFG